MKTILNKRIVSLLLALVMVLSMLPASVFAEEDAHPTDGTEQLITEPTEPEAPTEPTEPEAPTEPTEPEEPTEAPAEEPAEAPSEVPTKAPVAVYAADHVHKKGSDGNCTECSNPIIASMFSVTLGSLYFVTLAEAFEACTGSHDVIDMEANATLDETLTVDDHRVEINLNGYTISGDGSIEVDYSADQDNPGLYISANGGKLEVPIFVHIRGSLKIYGYNYAHFGEVYVYGKACFECESARFHDILVFGSTGELEINGDATIDSLTIFDGHPTVQLSGGTYIQISAPATAKAGDLLASGYVFARGKVIAPDTLLSDITAYPLNVILCRHTELDADGTCTFCGAPAEAKIGEKFFGSFVDAVNYANENPGSTIVLQSNISLPGTTAPEDWPYIAADTTVDLNGQTLDMVWVGKPTYDEDYEVTSVTPGKLTVTGRGDISNAITLHGGAVTITGGEINTLDIQAYVPCAATISGGEVSKLSTEDENDDATVDVTVSGGTVKSVSSSAGTITFNDHTEAAAGGTEPSWSVYSGKVIVNGGTFNFTLRNCTGSLILNGGTFSKITMSIYGSEATLSGLLGEGRAFYGEDGSLINAAALTTLTNVAVKAHEHPDFSDNGKCPECGAPCKHTTINETGKCTDCGAQFAVSLQVGSSISYHDSFEAAIDAAPRNMSEAVTITLLTDSKAHDIWGSRNITLNLNGKYLTGDDITVNDHCKLTLTGSFDEFSLPLYVNGDSNGTGELDRTGILVINPTGSAGVVKDISANASSRVTVLGGTIENLSIQTTDTKELDYIDLAGGTFNNISFQSIDGNVTLTDLLATGCAFRCDKDFSKYQAGDLIDYGFQLDADTLIRNLSVVPCEHPRVNEWKGYCGYCGKLYAAKITSADGTVTYLETLPEEGLTSAEGDTIKLLQNATKVTVSGSCTIELNERTIGTLDAALADELTLYGIGAVQNLFLGSNDAAAPHAATLVLKSNTSGAPTIGCLYVYKTTEDTKLTCGSFRCIDTMQAGILVADLLAEGYGLVDASGNVVRFQTNYYNGGEASVAKHTHSFTKNSDGSDECPCGMVCSHSSIGEDGKCSYCHYQLLVAALTFEDGTGAKFDNLTDAWEAAISFPGSTLKLLCDLTLDDSAEYFLAESGSFTFDLNGKTLEAEAQGYIFQIAGTANVTIKNGSIYNTFYFEPGQTQFFYGNGNAVSVKGGTAVLENLELTGGEGGSDDNYVKPCPIQLESTGSLTVTDCTVHGTLLLWVFDSSATTVQIASTVMYGGLDYTGLGTEKDPELIRSFFAEGNLLLTDEGKYIDLTDDAYWTFVTQGTVSFAQFTYSDSAKVTPHDHTYKDGYCTSCGAGCDHAGDDHSQKATYFKQAVCSVCGASYGDLLADTTAPTVTISGILAGKDIDDAVTFDKFVSGGFTIQVSATDDSYDHAGFNAETDSVKLSYLVVANGTKSREELEAAYDYPRFLPLEGSEYTAKPIDGTTYVIYIAAEDKAGNVTFLATEGYTADLTEPVITLVSPEEKVLTRNMYTYCTPEIVFSVTDANLASVKAKTSSDLTQDEDGNYHLRKDSFSDTQYIRATDKAGNETLINFALFESHSFDENGHCTQCGADAVAKLTLGETTTMFVTGDELFAALAEETTYDGASVTLLQDVTITANVSVKSDVRIDLNGKTLGDSGISIYGDVTICSTGNKGNITSPIAVQPDAELTMGEGLGSVAQLLPLGKINVYSGNYAALSSFRTPNVGTEAGVFKLYGGHFGSITLRTADVRDILAKGYRFEGLSYERATGKTASDVTVIPCDHTEVVTFGDTVCSGCGMQVYATVEDGTSTFVFDSFEAAIRCAETRENSLITLCRNIELNEQTAGSLRDGDYYRLTTGKYSIDLDGYTLTVADCILLVEGSCDLTITGYGRVTRPDISTSEIEVRTGAHLTVEGDDLTFTLPLTAEGTNTLTLKGGSFTLITGAPDLDTRKSCSPLQFLANGYAFRLADGTYANESNVKSQYVANKGTYYRIEEAVTVVSAPMSITTQPKHISLYATSPTAYRPKVEATAACVLDGAEAGEVTATLVKEGTGEVMATQTVPAAEAVNSAFSTENFTIDDRGGYRIKFAYRGYELFSEIFVINITNCNHTVTVGRWLGHEDKSTCPECHCDIAAAIQYKDSEKDVTYVVCYVDAADAFAAAQTDTYKDCTLTLLRDCAENLTISSGSFLLNTAIGCKMQGDIKVEKGAKLGIIGYNGSTNNSAFTGAVTCAGELTVDYAVIAGKVNCSKGGTATIKNATIGGNVVIAEGAAVEVRHTTIRGNVICAKGGKITAWPATIKGTVNCSGEGNFTFVTFEKEVSGKGESKLDLSNCELKANLNVSGTATLTGNRNTGVLSVSGMITVNNGGTLTVFGSDCNTMLVRSGGKAITYSAPSFAGAVTLESGSTMEISDGSFAKLAAQSGSTLTVKPIGSNTVTITTAEIGDVNGKANVTFYAGVTFGEITVNGQRPIDCLADGLGYWDNDHEEITDGRNQILSNVTVVAHTHDCVWNTATHEKLCGCGYVAATDTTAPVISGVTDGGVYYGGIQFSVSDENEFTVMIDGSVVSSPLNTFLIEPDNKAHVITATDIAGNTVSITVSVMMTYRVTLSRGEGYTITGDPVAKYGQDYTFTVEIAEGYSKTADFMVDVNGRPMHSSSGSYTYEFVESELHVTVFGVADITPPTAELTVGASTFDSFTGSDTFTLFFKTAQTVTVNASDAGSGVKAIEYLLSETAFASADAVTGDWTTLSAEDTAFTIEPNRKVFLYVRVTDESGNVQIIGSEGVVLYTDAEMRSSSVTYVMGSGAEPRFMVNLNGNRISAVYNGTQELRNNNDYTRYAYGDVKLNNRYLSTLAAGEYTIRVTFNPLGEAYVERDGNDAPAELTIQLSVKKKAPIIDHKDYDGKTYNGEPIGNLTYNTDSDGAVTLEFKPADADDTAYTTTAPKNVGTYTIRITVAESDAFLAASSTMTFEIYPKEVTISGVTVDSKVYDGTADAMLASNGVVSGAINGDDVTVVTGKAAFDDKNVGTGKTVTFSGFSLSGDAAKNYTLTAQPASVTADITPKEITIVGTTVAATKVYDGTTAATITSTGTPSENFDGEGLTVKVGTAAYDDKNVGTGKTVTFSGFSLSGDAAKNYTLTAQPASVTADITPKEITIVGTTVAATKVYDGTTAATITSTGTPSENFDGEGLTVKVGTAAYDDKNVGTGKTVTFSGFSLSGDAAKNYTLTAQPASVTADITAKEITIVGATVAATKVYDGTTTATITSTGAPSENFDGENLTVKVGTAAYDDKNVGTGKTVTFSGFSLSGDAAKNYTLAAQPASVTANITQKEITIVGATVAATKVYDGTTAAMITSTGAPSENFDGEGLTVKVGTAAYDDKNIGTGKTVTFSGFSLSGDAAKNYTLTAQPASVTADITPKEITIVGATVAATKVYDGTTAATITSTGAPSENFDGEGLTVKVGTAAYDDKNVGTGKTVTFSGFSLSGDAAKNYTLTAQPASVTADITPKEITIVGATVAATKVYDGTTAATITNAGNPSEICDGDELTAKLGTAAYTDKNVGIGKTVTFSGFELDGKDAANYKLTAQPADTTASITAKNLTIADLKVSDKQYDGTNAAAIEGTPTLVGVVEGDTLRLVNGVPTFENVTVGKDIPIRFTAFTLDGDAETAANYTLTQPTGITASIAEYLADGSEYSVNSNDWIHTDFVITAADGWQLSLTDTADGEWTQTLTASDETADGTLTFYVRNTETGVISTVVTEHYKIDKTAPTGTVALNERSAFQTVLNKITFGLFFNGNVNVKLTADDEASGIQSILYYKSDKLLDEAAVRALTDWTEGSDFDIPAEDMEQFVIYVRIEDNAGNVTYIGSDGVIFDTTAPEIIGVEDGETYYVTKRVAVDDENLAAVTLNGEPVSEVFSLTGDTDATYVIRAIDKAGNETEITVTMKPISSVTDAIAAITVESVKSSDAETIEAVERQVLDIAEPFDDEESTAEEWQQLVDAAAKCKALEERIAAVAAEIDRITEAVNGYDIDTVTSDDKANIEQLIADIDTLLNGDNLTDAEREALEALKKTAKSLLDRIAAVAAEIDRLAEAVNSYDIDTVTSDDKADIEQLIADIDALLNGDNLTEAEREALEALKETAKSLLDRIAEVAAEIDRLTESVNGYDIDTVTSDDKADIEQLIADIDALLNGDNLTEAEREALEALKETAKSLLDRIAEVAAEIDRLTESVNGYDIDTVTSDDKADIEQLIADIDALLNGDNLTEAEREALEALKETAKSLLDRIAEVAAEIDRITEAVNGYDIDTVTSDDKADIEQLIADIDALLNGDNLTEAEREALEALKETAKSLLDRIAEVAAEIDRITEAVNGYDIDTVTSDDKANIEQLIADIDALLDGDNLTEAEREALEALKETAKTLLDRIAENLKPTEDVCKPFIDIDQNAWYHAGVHYMIENGMMNGVGNGRFAPDGTLTRAMLVTILYRQAGSPSVEGKTNPFTDAQKGYYADAVTWAYAHKITNGATETTFEPDAPATREQIATILYRREGEPEVKQDLSAFSDADQITGYARAAMQWAVAKKIIQGDGDRLNARGDATRAEIATMLMRYLSK